MQYLVCPVGGSLRVDDDIQVVIHDRLGERVTFGVVAPGHLELTLDDAALRPAPQAGGGCWYLFSLLNVRAFRIGSVEVRLVSPAGTSVDAASPVQLVVLGAERLRVQAEDARVSAGPARRVPAVVELLQRFATPTRIA